MKKSWYSITAQGDVPEVFIYDEIGIWGISAEELVRELRELTDPLIRVRINSPGGSIFEGIAIYNALVRHPATIEVHIDGLAASIASVIALASDNITIASYAFVMIHEPMGFAFGTAEEMHKRAETLERLEKTLVDIYTAKTNMTAEEAREQMAAETWFDATEAIATGFANNIAEEDETDETDDEDRFDLSMYENTPTSLSRDPITVARGLEHSLREAGMSRSQAKRVAISGFLGLRQWEVDGADPGEIQAVRSLVGRIERETKALNQH